jgi:hypothetical protein
VHVTPRLSAANMYVLHTHLYQNKQQNHQTLSLRIYQKMTTIYIRVLYRQYKSKYKMYLHHQGTEYIF